MRRRYGSRGESKIGCAIWAILLLVFSLVVWKAIPVKMDSSALYDYMEEQARFAGRRSAEQIKERIMERAEQLELPVDPKKLQVQRVGGRVRMKVTYTVPLEFPGYTYYWTFTHEVDRPVFIV